MYRTSIIILFFLISGNALAQGQNRQDVPNTLRECIEIALQNNLDLQASKLRTETAAVNYRQGINSMLPSLNASYNLGIVNGRSIDPFTNDYVNQELTFSNASLGVDAVLFNGFRLINSLKQRKLNLKASEMEVEEAKQNLIFDVTLAFLQVLNTRDLYKLSQSRLETTQGQLDRLKTLFKEESGNPAEFRDLQGQFANDQAIVVQAANNLKEAVINLSQLLNINTPVNPENIDILVDFREYERSAAEIYADALNNLATFKARELRVEAASRGVAVAKAQYVPQVSLFANLGTNYSSAARLFTETGTRTVETGDFIDLDGDRLFVLTEETGFQANEISYGDQFENNLNSAVGLAVDIPIFNGFRAKNNVTLEKIREREAQVMLEQTQLEFRQAIKQAYNDMQAALARHEILKEQVEAYRESFRINEIRFNNGVSNSVEYIISKNNLDNALINLANVKYEYVLRVKVLEYYSGSFL